MDKISGIVPANSRTSVTDTSNSQPVRPGAPAYGRKIGRANAAAAMEIDDRATFSSEARSMADQQKVNIARDMADKFAMKNTKDEINADGALSQKLTDDMSDKFFDRGE